MGCGVCELVVRDSLVLWYPAGPVGLGPARVASVVHNTEMKVPIDLEELVFPPPPLF